MIIAYQVKYILSQIFIFLIDIIVIIIFIMTIIIIITYLCIGPIPAQIGALTKLQYLNLNSNRLSGKIYFGTNIYFSH